MRLFYKYNPQRMNEEELTRIFTGRDALLADMLGTVKGQSRKKHLQHLILQGPRGMGKTHLLCMVYYGVRKDPELSSAWLPIQFAEEEFGICDLKSLFIRILEELSKSDDSKHIQEAIRQVTGEEETQKASTRAYSFLKDYLSKKSLRIVLLIDNINQIFAHLSNIEEKRLRDILMNDPYILIFGAAVTTLGELKNEGNPFYMLFRIDQLQELNEKDFNELFHKKMASDGRDETLSKLPALSARLRALYHLTGGNPRLLLILYEFATLGDIQEVISYLHHVLDEQTPYFLEKMRELTPQMRSIIDTMAKSEILIAPAEIARRVGMKTNQVTAQIAKMVDMAYLCPIKLSSRKKGTYYEFSERIFRIWYQMRIGGRQKERIGFLLDFLQMWYEVEELEEKCKELGEEYSMLTEKGSDVKRLRDVEEYLEYFREASEKKAVAGAKQGKKKPAGSDKSIEKALESITEGRYSEGISLLKKLEESGKVKDSKVLSQAWFDMGYALGSKKEHDRAIECYLEGVRLKPDKNEAWNNMGNAHYAKKEYDRAIECYMQAVRIKPDMHEAWNNMASAHKGKKEYDRAIECYMEAVRIKPDMNEAWYNMGNVHYETKEYDRAIECYEKYLYFILPNVNRENIREESRYLTLIFRKMMKIDRYEDAHRLFEMVRKSDSPVAGVLQPVGMVIDYLHSGDKTLLELQPSEYKEIVQLLLAKVGSGNR